MRFLVIWLSYQDIWIEVIYVQIYMFPQESFVCFCVAWEPCSQ